MNLQFSIPGVVSRRYISQSKGRGLFAEKSFEKDEVIFSERPLFSVQHVYNRSTAWTCGNCFKFLGSLGRQMAHYKKIFGLRDNHQLPEFMGEPEQLSQIHEFQTKVYSCFAKCGEKYCSEECRNISFYNHHQILCVGEQTADNNPMYLFKKHSIETNELFFLAAQAIAFLICKIGNDENPQSVNMVDTICKDFFNEYFHRDWWEVRIDGNFSLEEAKAWSHESLDLLRKALVPILKNNPRTNNDNFINTILSMEFYSHLLGLLEMNDNSIGFHSPLELFRKNIDSIPLSEQHRTQSKKALESIVAAFREHHKAEDDDCDEEECNHHDHSMQDDHDDHDHHDHDMDMEDEDEEEEEIFPSFDGFGIFGLQAMVNHSCEPNCTVVFQGDNRAIIKALRRIEVGEELLHSYIDESEPYQERQQELITYGFHCDCSKCLSEKPNTTITSTTSSKSS